MRHFLFFFALWAIIAGGLLSTATAMEAEISIVVNEDAISELEVKDRLKLILSSSGIPNTSQNRERLLPQVQNMLIEESLKVQEAEKFEIEVTDEEIQGGVGQIAQQNNMTLEQFAQVIDAQGIPRRTLKNQVRAQIAWGKVVQSQLRPQVQISDNDVDAELNRLESINTPAPLPGREELLNKLGLERLNRLQARYLQDLRSEAFIENRG